MKTENEHRERDLATLRVLGSFFAIMGVLVLIGTLEAVGNTAAVVVSVCSGVALLIVGLGMWLVSRRFAAPPPEPDP